MALVHYMVPVVMGTSLGNYKERLPPNSFIHVDNFTGPKELASYINYLDKNDNAYRHVTMNTPLLLVHAFLF